MIGFAAVVLITAQVLLGIYIFQEQQRIPAQKGTTYAGKTIDVINPTEGSHTLVSFWASTCLPCIKEMPDFIELHNDYQSYNLNITGITMPFDQADLTLAVIQKFQIPWPNVIDTQGKHVAAFGDIKAVPTTLLVDHTGKVKWKQEGPVDFKKLRQTLNQHLSPNKLPS